MELSIRAENELNTAVGQAKPQASNGLPACLFELIQKLMLHVCIIVRDLRSANCAFLATYCSLIQELFSIADSEFLRI